MMIGSNIVDWSQNSIIGYNLADISDTSIKYVYKDSMKFLAISFNEKRIE